jgi:hypothetical protein
MCFNLVTDRRDHMALGAIAAIIDEKIFERDVIWQ